MPWEFARLDHYLDDGEGVEQLSGEVIPRERYPALYRPMFFATKQKIMKWIEPIQEEKGKE